MPDLTPSLDLMKRLGLSTPPSSEPISDDNRKLADILARQQQANDPSWKKAARVGIGSLVGAVKGIVGTDPSDDVKQRIISGTATPDEKAEWYSSGAAQIGQNIADAGLPFAAYGKNVFHGTPKPFDKFNPELNDVHDVLGWLTHFAEDSDYADMYAMGNMKHGSYDSTPTMIAAQPQAKNVLDLVNPNTDDLAQVIASYPKDSQERQNLINVFKGAKRNPELFRNDLDLTHFPERNKIPANEIPMLSVSESLRLKPGELEKTPFDAIRYNDMNNKSWAIPDDTPIQTPWGTQMNNTSKQLNVTRLPDDYQGTSELHVANSKMKPWNDLSPREKADYLYDQIQSNNGNFPNDDPYLEDKFSGSTKKSNYSISQNDWNKQNPMSYENLSATDASAEYVKDLMSAYNLHSHDAKTLVDNTSFNDIEGLLKGDVSGFLKKYPNNFNDILTPEITGIIPNTKNDSHSLSMGDMIDEADELGIDWAKAKNNSHLEQMIKDHKATSNVHDLGNKEDYSEYFQPDTSDEMKNLFGPSLAKTYNPTTSNTKTPSGKFLTHHELINEAEKLGIDYHKLPDYDAVEAAVQKAWGIK